jgi:hypothetical protein
MKEKTLIARIVKRLSFSGSDTGFCRYILLMVNAGSARPKSPASGHKI